MSIASPRRSEPVRPARAQPSTRGGSQSDTHKTQLIRTEVNAAADRARLRHPWLAHQDLIGLTIQLGSIGGMVLCAALYLQGLMPWWATIPLVAILASLTHEMEHDLIHHMYFKQQPWVQNLLLGLGWLARPSTINPWLRRHLHFQHHKRSGTANDLEERGITNGERWGVRRFLMTGDGMLALAFRLPMILRLNTAFVKDYFQPKTRRELVRKSAIYRSSYAPLGYLFWFAWHAYFLFHAADLISTAAGHPVAWPSQVLHVIPVLDALAVCLLIPNVLRSFCLNLISSNMHYYGDVELGNVMQQCQVINHPLFWPLQLFCFNFGATHAIHHFVVGQPFYLRQMIAGEALAVMRKMGVRFNDFGTFARANRLHATA
jgi:fatty acid desaturase